MWSQLYISLPYVGNADSPSYPIALLVNYAEYLDYLDYGRKLAD